MAVPLLRPAAPADAAALAAFAAECFVETFVRGFAIPYSPADLTFFLEETSSPAAFSRMIADPATDVRLREDAAGLALYTVTAPPALPHADVRPRDAEIKRFYLRADLKGAGLAAPALEETLDRLDPGWRMGAGRPIWLSVWSGNLRAQRFYARYGFAQVGDYAFPVGAQLDHDFIFRRG